MKTKTTIITALLMLAMVSGAVAQEKWEYANIIYYAGGNKLSISLNGTEFSETKIEVTKEENSILNSNPLFIKVHEFQNKGWEVMNINSFGVGIFIAHAAYLRKTKTN